MTSDTTSTVVEGTIDSFEPIAPDDVDDEQVSITGDDGTEHSLTGWRLLITHYRVIDLIEALADGVDRGLVLHSEAVGSGYAADLEAAFQVGQTLVDKHGIDQIKREGIDVLDHEDRVAVRANVVPIAEHVNVDLAAEDLEVSD